MRFATNTHIHAVVEQFISIFRSTLILVDFNADAVEALKKEIEGNHVSGQAFVAPRTSVTVSLPLCHVPFLRNEV